MEVKKNSDVSLGTVTVTDGQFALYTQKADAVSGGDGYVGWSFIKLVNDDPLPVELTSFSAQVNEGEVTLNWETETEVDNYGFEVQRSVFGVQSSEWIKIGFVEGHGNSNSPKQYSFADKKPVGGSNFSYRLKQIDTDGKFEYSDFVEVLLVPAEFFLSQNFPNPFNPTTKIRYQLPKESKVVIKIYDILGAEVITLLKEKKEPGVYEVELNAQSLPSGTYLYRIISGDFIETKKMVHLR